jgi:hypothetical protein
MSSHPRQREACRAEQQPARPVRALRSGASSALIDRDELHPAKRSGRGSYGAAGAGDDPLDRAPVVVSIERVQPGSALDEQLCREQVGVLLDLLADHMRRRKRRERT